MAITFDASSENSGVAVSSLTISHTVSGTDRMLWVEAGGNRIPTGVTWNTSEALTKLVEEDNFGMAHSLWYLVSPSTGTHDVVVSISTGNIYGAVASYTGVSQTFPDSETFAESNALSVSSRTPTVTTVADNCWLVMGAVNFDSATQTAGASTTQRNTGVVSDYGGGIYDSNAAKSPAGSYGLTVNTSATTNIHSAVAAMKPAAGGGGASVLPIITHHYRQRLG